VIPHQTLPQHCPRQVEKDRDAARPVDHLAVGIAAKGTASGGHNNVIQFSTVLKFVALGGPESCLTESCEYLWNRGVESSTDLPIEIDEAKAQAIRQRSSDRALSSTHETNQEDSAHTPQCYHPARVRPCAKPELVSFFGPGFFEFSILNSQF
jgi:hypothetical protein